NTGGGLLQISTHLGNAKPLVDVDPGHTGGGAPPRNEDNQPRSEEAPGTSPTPPPLPPPTPAPATPPHPPRPTKSPRAAQPAHAHQRDHLQPGDPEHHAVARQPERAARHRGRRPKHPPPAGADRRGDPGWVAEHHPAPPGRTAARHRPGRGASAGA